MMPLRPGWPPPIVGGDAAGVGEPITWRERIVAHVRGLVGLSAPEAAYLDAICACALDRSTRAEQLATMSSCALVVRAMWAALGIVHALLAAPYRIGMAVVDVVVVARAAGALRPATSRPREGDVVILDGPEHVLTVTGWRGDVLLSVDGGQGPGGRAIAERERAWSPGWLGGRRILHVIDADAMATLASAA